MPPRVQSKGSASKERIKQCPLSTNTVPRPRDSWPCRRLPTPQLPSPEIRTLELDRIIEVI